MAKFNDIDNDFTCPFECALITMLSGPATCMRAIIDGTCVHPAALEVTEADKQLEAMSAQVSLRLFSSVFQKTIALVGDEDGNEYLAVEDDEGHYVPMTGPLTSVSPEMADQLRQIQQLPELEM